MGDKLAPRYYGPYVIDEELGKGVYRLHDDKGPLKQTANACNLKAWNEQLSADHLSSNSPSSPCNSSVDSSSQPQMSTASKSPPKSPPASNRSCVPSSVSCETSEAQLNDVDFQDLSSPTKWLSDRHMDAVNSLVARHIGSNQTQSTLNAQSAAGFDPVTMESVQILHDKSHWVTTGIIGGRVLFMDSLGKPISEYVKVQMRQLYAPVMTAEQKLPVVIVPTSKQQNSHDCGLYAAAYAFSMALGSKSYLKTYNNSLMRAHLAQCLRAQVVQEFPLEEVEKKKRGRVCGERLKEI
jgi:hypothetical protein